MASHRIIVGIDFGTTFSGVAWTPEECPDDLEVISTWPGSQNRTSEKVPTVMSYDTSKVKNGFRWGYQVAPFADNIYGLKLLLDEDQENRYGPSRESKTILCRMGKDPVDVASDYLRALFEVAKSIQIRRLGVAYVNSATFRIVLTVPAVWSDKAKDATLRAAEYAGLDAHELSVVSEPEAAALYTLQAIQPNTITNGDTFVVCDAGGGTVDLITYQVRSVEPLDLAEVVKGAGGICGSALLDRRFEDFVRNRLGVQWSQLSPKGRQAMMSSWVNDIKCSFSGTDDDEDDLLEYLIVVPNVSDNEQKGIAEGMMLVESAEIEKIFMPIVNDIENLVQAQIDQAQALGYTIKAILLVGGFGSSTYLYRMVRMKFPHINIMQPPNAWTSVVRGAVLRGACGNVVSSRKARRNYGIGVRRSFDPQGDPLHCREWDLFEEKWKATGRMSWFVSKGMQLSDGKKISLPFYRVLDVNHTDFVFVDHLLCCNDDTKPDDSTHASIFTLCTLKADLGKVPKALFKKSTNSGNKSYYKIEYRLEMSFSSASIFFELFFEDVSYGSIKAKF